MLYFLGDSWNGGKYESKKTLQLSYPILNKEKPLNVLFYTRIFRGNIFLSNEEKKMSMSVEIHSCIFPRATH